MSAAAVEIILIEDDPNDAELIQRALRRFGVANRIQVVRGRRRGHGLFLGDRAATDTSPRVHPKLVLLDLKIPKVGGLEVLRRLKGDERTRRIPVVVLTSSDRVKDREDSYRLGANGYVTKPVEFEEFRRVVVETGLYWLVTNEPPPAA